MKMILMDIIIILVFVKTGHRERENCLGYDESSKVVVIDLLGPKYDPAQYVLNKNVNITQLLYNTCGRSMMKFNSIKEEIFYSFLQDLTSRLINYLKENGTLFLAVLIFIRKYRKLNNHLFENKESLLKLTKKFEEQCKDLGRVNSCLAQHNEKIIRHDIEKMKDFGSDFAQGVKIVSLQHAVQHMLEKSDKNVGNLSQRVEFICSKIRDSLRPNNDANNSEFVTGIQKNILIWYLEGVRGYQNHAELENKLGKFPWVGEDGKLSLVNVRKCIRFVHKDLKQTLAFLAQTINWDDLQSFVSSRPKKNKGKNKGHGLYFLMFHFYASYCEETNATANEKKYYFSFPPSGEIELDAQGTIEAGADTTKIKIGEMKISMKKIPEAKKQLKRSLLFFALLHKFMAVDKGVAPPFYDLTGYIFISGVKKVTQIEELPLPPLGKISYITFNS